MECLYCQDLEKYSLVPATPCILSRSSWSPAFAEHANRTFLGHKMKYPMVDMPDYNIICKEDPNYETLDR
jgi:hypothetical protein